MKITLVTALVLTVLCLVIPTDAEAHHGWTEFDSSHEIVLEGTVTDFHFVNPHCVVEFDAKDEKGQVHNWQGEFSNPPQLTRKGWSASSLEAGNNITVTGYPARKGARAVHVTRIRVAGGPELKIEEGR